MRFQGEKLNLKNGRKTLIFLPALHTIIEEQFKKEVNRGGIVKNLKTSNIVQKYVKTR